MINIIKLVFISIAFMTSCAFSQDVEKSWEEAVVYMLGKSFPTSVNKVTVDNSMPVAIYLHGCAGINKTHDASWASLLTDHGFIVVMPDSMARPNRIPNCDPRVKGGNAFPSASKYRQQEIGYAIAQVQKVSWADKRNVFLIGFSEGGIGVAQSTHSGFAGKIMMGWTCIHKNNSDFDGIYSFKETPVLAIASIHDDWRAGKPTEGRCAEKAQGRSNFKQIDIPGSEHQTFGSPEAQKAVKIFLTDYRIK